MFCATGFHGFVEANASAPTAKFQAIRVVLAVIAYRKWNFRVMDVSRAFLMSGPLKRETYAKHPNGVEKETCHGRY